MYTASILHFGLGKAEYSYKFKLGPTVYGSKVLFGGEYGAILTKALINVKCSHTNINHIPSVFCHWDYFLSNYHNTAA